MKKVRKALVAILLVTSFMIPLFFSAIEAEAASGNVISTGDPIVGIWIEVPGGKSGWAARTGENPRRQTWNYNTQGKKWNAHIGTGGTSENWERTHVTGYSTRQETGVQLTAIMLGSIPIGHVS